jgi:hypothetical protein
MLAATPLTSPKRLAVVRPTVPGSSVVTWGQLGVPAVLVAIAFASLAPATALAVAIAATVVAAIWFGFKAAGSEPEALTDAHRKAASLALVAHYSFIR